MKRRSGSEAVPSDCEKGRELTWWTVNTSEGP